MFCWLFCVHQVIVDVPCPLSNLQAMLYRRVCAAAAASAVNGAGATCSLLDPLGFCEEQPQSLSHNEEGDEEMSRVEKQQQQQLQPASPSSSSISSWRGLKSLRALSQLCTHPCLAVPRPAFSNKSSSKDESVESRMSFAGATQQQHEHPRYHDWYVPLHNHSIQFTLFSSWTRILLPCARTFLHQLHELDHLSEFKALAQNVLMGCMQKKSFFHTFLNRHRDVTASSKFQALKDLLQQLGFVASEPPALQQQQHNHTSGVKRLRRNDKSASKESEIAERSDDDEDDDDERDGDKENDNEEENISEQRNAMPPQKFILFAQNR